MPVRRSPSRAGRRGPPRRHRFRFRASTSPEPSFLTEPIAHARIRKGAGCWKVPMPQSSIDRCYWTRTAPSDAFPALCGDIEVDVAIVGGGIVGTLAARQLKDRGYTVAVVEAERVGHGVTGRS